jgi:hypothetical protein
MERSSLWRLRLVDHYTPEKCVTCARDRGELKPGAKIFIAGTAKRPDGSFVAARVGVGRDGLSRRCKSGTEG